ncbi:ABC transporter ATP-binding protein [Haloactinopolyspora sp.]|uniref:ABC transporter ATP-binding protein n=1 Tax=Haloactinopolyspora sp. TaxID=1966353 RepID=UPI002620BD33|nr:ABC transporter ATP-binding protein [Haloactinopolyspora sp.]
MNVSPAVDIDGLVKRYGHTTAVDGLSVRFPAGAVTAVLGPNGAGKTTTVEICEGLRRADSGRVRVLGRDPLRDGAVLRPRVGVMLQEGAGFYPGARAIDMLTHLARLHRTPLDADQLIERLGLRQSAGTPLRRLSGGQRQRVALAAALIGRPELVFLDEPTAGLDPHVRRATWDLISELRSDGVTVVLTTHLIDEAEQLADHVVIIDAGRLAVEGSPQELTAGVGDGVITFGGPPRLDLSSLRAALPETAEVREVTPGGYQVTASVDPHLLATLTSWCATHDILAEGLQVGRRSLEDIYLEATGRAR